MNYFRMTIRTHGDFFQVFKLSHRRHGGYSTDMAAAKFSFVVSAAARPRFTGTYAQCVNFIELQGAEYMSEHGLPV